MLSFSFGAFSQADEGSATISEVKVVENHAQIYDAEGNMTGNIYICPECTFEGNNQSYVLMMEAHRIKIYDGNGGYTGNKVNACSKCEVGEVYPSDFLVTDGEAGRYFNFYGEQVEHTDY